MNPIVHAPMLAYLEAKYRTKYQIGILNSDKYLIQTTEFLEQAHQSVYLNVAGRRTVEISKLK